jgi:hypothetical protein
MGKPMADPTSIPPSDYPAISLPPGGFRSNLPEHLLKDASPADRWLMEEMSKNTQATEFSCRAAVDTNAQVRHTNGRVKSAEAKVADLQADVAALKTQMAAVNPLVSTVSTVRVLFSNKVVLIVVGGFTLFLLGYNRDVLPAIFKFFFGA